MKVIISWPQEIFWDKKFGPKPRLKLKHEYLILNYEIYLLKGNCSTCAPAETKVVINGETDGLSSKALEGNPLT